MKKLVVHIGLLFSIIILLPLSSFSQWEMATGLDGGVITDMVSVDSVLFALTGGTGVYSKSDNGDWERSFNYFKFNYLEKAGNCVFAYYSNYGDDPIRSSDYGVSWESVPNIGNTRKMHSIDTVIFFGSYCQSRSFDCGNTYDTIQFPMPLQGQYLTVFSDDSLLYAHYWDINDVHSLFYSNDYGDTWNTININGLFIIPYIRIQQIKYLNGTFWAQLEFMNTGYAFNTVHVYNDALNKWEDVTGNLPYFTQHNHLFEYDGNILCSQNSYPVFKFNYTDSLWAQFADASKNVNQFLLHNDELFCATDQGPCSLDTSGNWTTYYTGLQHRNITSIDEQDGIIYVTANNELFYSEDGGNNFARNENTFGFQIIVTDTVFYTISPHEYHMSWDEGATWQSFSDSLEDNYNPRLTRLSISPDYYYIGTGRGLFRSHSDSISWVKVENGPFNSNFIVHNVEAIRHTVMIGEWLYAQRLYFSVNNGYSYIEFDEFSRFAKINESYYLLKDSIHYSDNTGITWEAIPVRPTGNHIYCIDRKEDTIIIGGRDIYANPILRIAYYEGGFFYDLMDNLPVSTSDPWIVIEELKIVDGRIFVGNPKHGLWYRDDILTHASEKPTIIETDNLFINVYPNPLSTATTFQYTLQQSSQVQIIVYNHFGKQVDVISNYQFSGKQNVIWRSNGLPSGIYYFTIKAGEHVASGKMMVIR